MTRVIESELDRRHRRRVPRENGTHSAVAAPARLAQAAWLRLVRRTTSRGWATARRSARGPSGRSRSCSVQGEHDEALAEHASIRQRTLGGELPTSVRTTSPSAKTAPPGGGQRRGGGRDIARKSHSGGWPSRAQLDQARGARRPPPNRITGEVHTISCRGWPSREPEDTNEQKAIIEMVRPVSSDEAENPSSAEHYGLGVKEFRDDRRAERELVLVRRNPRYGGAGARTDDLRDEVEELSRGRITISASQHALHRLVSADEGGTQEQARANASEGWATASCRRIQPCPSQALGSDGRRSRRATKDGDAYVPQRLRRWGHQTALRSGVVLRDDADRPRPNPARG